MDVVQPTGELLRGNGFEVTQEKIIVSNSEQLATLAPSAVQKAMRDNGKTIFSVKMPLIQVAFQDLSEELSFYMNYCENTLYVYIHINKH